MKKHKTTEEFRKEVTELTTSKFEVLGQYINKETGIQIKCNICKNKFDIKPKKFLHNLKCSTCGYQIDLEEIYNIKSLDDFIKKVGELTNEFIVTGKEYIDLETRIEILHKKCNK